MLIRIATYSLAALLACSVVASAEAAPPKQKPKTLQKPAANPELDKWGRAKPARLTPIGRHPDGQVSKTTPMTTAVFVDEARIERAEEGLLLYSVEIPPEMREEMAKFKGVPLSRIPDRSFKTARISAAHSLSERELKKKVGDEFRLELRQDPKGFVYVTALTSAKPIKRK